MLHVERLRETFTDQTFETDCQEGLLIAIEVPRKEYFDVAGVGFLGIVNNSPVFCVFPNVFKSFGLASVMECRPHL